MVKKLEKGATVTCYKCHGEVRTKSVPVVDG
jgi:hypothetical protein